MYGGQPRSSMPCVSQALRNRTTSRSTRVTSSISNAITLALALISASKSGSASTRSLPMSLMLVPSLPLIVSIFSVTLDRRSNERAREKLRWDGQREKQSTPCFRQLPNYQQSAANLVQRILARCFRSRNKCLLLGNALHDLSVCFVPAPALGGHAKSSRAIEGSQITSAMLLPADKASCARSGEGTVVEVKRTGNGCDC